MVYVDSGEVRHVLCCNTRVLLVEYSWDQARRLAGVWERMDLRNVGSARILKMMMILDKEGVCLGPLGRREGDCLGTMMKMILRREEVCLSTLIKMTFV